ncbi:MAG: ParB N-terminal domain-containing protein [Zoogloea sp.]|nr:ParB N-terminal domain-containing protein [Zoogloea sp.]
MVSRKENNNSGASELGDRVISINRLHLDPLNPRHEPLKSDAEIIQQLCKDEKVAELASDIASRGSLSPLDVLGAIPYKDHPGHYIAIEGNRRTCALILLADPSRAPTRPLQDQFRRIAGTAKPPREVKVHVFADRRSAKPWMDLRHLGPQGGVGTVEWNADQKTRAAGDNTRTSSRANTLALAVLDRLVEIGLLTGDQRRQVSLTTITRYLGTPGVRAILGLGSAKELIYTHTPSEVDAALQHIVLDSIQAKPDGTFAVHSRSSSADRLAYANTLKASGISPSTPLPEPSTPQNPTSKSAASSTTLTGKTRSARNPAKLPTLFDRSFTVAHKDDVLLRLREECLTLQIEDFPFSANYLLRAFVEQTMILFAKKRGKYSSTLTNEALTQLCATELKAMGITGKALNVISKAAGSAAQPHSLHSLGNAVHGGMIPDKRSLRAIFDNWKPSLRAMLDAL